MSDKQATPAYMVVSGTVVKPDHIGPYAEAAGPLAEAAGMEVAALGKPRLLEGQWPHSGEFVAVERFPSMDDLLKFWQSPEYQEAKKFREGVVDIDFIIAVEQT